MHIICWSLTNPLRGVFENEKVMGKNGNFSFSVSYLAISKDFWECYMKNFDIAKNLIGQSMLVKTSKALSQKSSSTARKVFF